MSRSVWDSTLGGFSPDGNKCLFSWDTTGHEESSGRGLEHHIYILDLTSNTKVDISSGIKPDGTNDIHATFTPDGNKILFVNGPNNVGWFVDSR
ncbi:MAG: hypothetical protein QME52_04865 [Bacteroidota bacterium]|nr:hypothetical protein [Bacteroidota bacterium]